MTKLTGVLVEAKRACDGEKYASLGWILVCTLYHNPVPGI